MDTTNAIPKHSYGIDTVAQITQTFIDHVKQTIDISWFGAYLNSGIPGLPHNLTKDAVTLLKSNQIEVVPVFDCFMHVYQDEAMARRFVDTCVAQLAAIGLPTRTAFLDIEQSPVPSAPFVKGWCQGLSEHGITPGLYCPGVKSWPGDAKIISQGVAQSGTTPLCWIAWYDLTPGSPLHDPTWNWKGDAPEGCLPFARQAQGNVNIHGSIVDVSVLSPEEPELWVKLLGASAQ
jgi:hypothetical protein